MAEWPEAGQEPERDEPQDEHDDEPGDEFISGTVVPFPKQPPAEADDEPAPVAKRKPGGRGELRPIIPEHLRTWAGVKKAATWRLHRWRHISLYHLVRLPKRLALTLAWAALGVVNLEFVQIHWWWVSESAPLRSKAVREGDSRTWESLHKHAIKVRLTRGLFLLAEHVVILLAAGLLTAFFPWGWVPVGLVVVPLLAMVGNPTDTPVMGAATTPVTFEALSIEIVIRALLSLRMAGIERAYKEHPKTAFQQVDPICRDGAGWLCRLDLPYGVTAGDVSEKREELASGLRRPLGVVWPETDHRRHPGALALYVADQEMAKASRTPWPLAKRGTADVFAPVVFATDPRGRTVAITLIFASIIIGSIPRMGKTWLLRLLLLICALDVRVEIHAHDFKGTGDLKPVAQVAHRYRAGDEDDDMEYLMADMRAMRIELRRRAKVIRGLDDKRCPENKVTPELAADKRLGLHPIAIAWDECQIPFEHPKYGKELISIMTDFVKRGPALGFIAMLATQRPDAASVPTPISANAILRLCLKVMGQVENDMILGTSMYKNGFRATMFGREDLGVCLFAGEGRDPQIVWSYGFDMTPSKAIAARARMMREAAGTLSGYALGEDDDAEVRSIANDVLLVFRDDIKLYTDTIAERLRDTLPAFYADITTEAVRSQLAALGVLSKKIREPGGDPLAGFERAAIAAVIANPES